MKKYGKIKSVGSGWHKQSERHRLARLGVKTGRLNSNINYSKMPEGWMKVKWKDSSGNIWNDSIPKSTYSDFNMNVMVKGGIVVKTDYAKSTLRKKFDLINNNNVKLQNFRNSAITYYVQRGYSPDTVIDYIDDVLLPELKRYTPDYTEKVKDIMIPKIDNDILKSLNVKLSVKYPPKIKGDYAKISNKKIADKITKRFISDIKELNERSPINEKRLKDRIEIISGFGNVDAEEMYKVKDNKSRKKISKLVTTNISKYFKDQTELNDYGFVVPKGKVKKLKVSKGKQKKVIDYADGVEVGSYTTEIKPLDDISLSEDEKKVKPKLEKDWLKRGWNKESKAIVGATKGLLGLFKEGWDVDKPVQVNVMPPQRIHMNQYPMNNQQLRNYQNYKRFQNIQR